MIEVKPTHTEAIASRDGQIAVAQAAQKGRSLYDNVVKQFNKAADLMRLDLNIQRILEKTANEIIVTSDFGQPMLSQASLLNRAAALGVKRPRVRA